MGVMGRRTHGCSQGGVRTDVINPESEATSTTIPLSTYQRALSLR